MACSGGCGKSSSIVAIPAEPAFYGNHADYRMVRYIGDGASNIIGAVSGTDYGQRNNGDLVFVHEDDITVMNEVFEEI